MLRVQHNESAIHIHIISYLLAFLAIQVPTVHYVEFPVLYTVSLLVIYFINSISIVYVSILISQFLPLHPFPPWCPYIYSLPFLYHHGFLTLLSSWPFPHGDWPLVNL